MTLLSAQVHAGHPGWYKDCPDPVCWAHRRGYQKRWSYERSHGLLRTCTAAQARTHIDMLIGLGWSLRAIAGAADISPTTVLRVRDGQDKVRKTVAAAIIDVDPNTVPSKPSKQSGEPFVPKVGTVRRIQALIFMGWPHSEITKRIGSRSAVIVNQQGRWVTRTTHEKVAALYDEIGMLPGPSPRSRGWARCFGYAGPLAWDDIDHDQAPNLDGTDLEEAS